jgi:hypothetical protein
VADKIIEIVVKPDGTSSLHTTGFQGGECKKASLPYEQALGAKTSDVATAESLVSPTQQKLQTKLGG